MLKKAIVLICSTLFFYSEAQHLLPVKLNKCHPASFCLDCGDVKANPDSLQFSNMMERLSRSPDLAYISGKIKFQVIVDTVGKACVMSHNDALKTHLTKMILRELVQLRSWIPASVKGRPQNASIMMEFEIKDKKIDAKVVRVDGKVAMKMFDHPANPEIENVSRKYKTVHLERYAIEVLNSKNSELGNNFLGDIAVDNDNVLWLTVAESFLRFDGNGFVHVEQQLPDSLNFYSVASDNANVKWLHTKSGLLSYNNQQWQSYSQAVTKFDIAYRIVHNKASNETFFCTNLGLIIHKEGKWLKINQDSVKALPSNKVFFARRDSKNNLWIGTNKGTVVLQPNGQIQESVKTGDLLKGKCITSMDEDGEGNLYFSLIDYSAKEKTGAYKEGGILIRHADGSMQEFVVENSGIPVNGINKVLFDRFEHILWLSTDRAGLVRFDLNDTWEVYNNLSSTVPTSAIRDMVMDNKGLLYVATAQGLVILTKR